MIEYPDASIVNYISDDDRILSIEFLEILLDLLGGQHLELSVFSHNSYFDVVLIHFSLESLLKSEKGCMNGVFDLHVSLVSFFQEYLCVFGVLANSSCLPVVVGS